MTTTPTPTTSIGPRISFGRPTRCYTALWEIDATDGVELTVMRSEGGYYCAAFLEVTFERASNGRVLSTCSAPMSAAKWRIETTARYSAKRLGEVYAATMETLADRLAATSPTHAAALERVKRAAALGAMYAAAYRLHHTHPEADPTRCKTYAEAGESGVSITYPSGNTRVSANYDDEQQRWEVAAYPDEIMPEPYNEDRDLSDDDLAAALTENYQRTI